MKSSKIFTDVNIPTKLAIKFILSRTYCITVAGKIATKVFSLPELTYFLLLLLHEIQWYSSDNQDY